MTMIDYKHCDTSNNSCAGLDKSFFCSAAIVNTNYFENIVADDIMSEMDTSNESISELKSCGLILLELD